MIKKFKYLFWVGVTLPTLFVVFGIITTYINGTGNLFYYFIFIINYLIILTYLYYFFILMHNNSGFLNELIGVHFEEIFSDSNLGLIVYDNNDNIIWINQYLLNNGFKNFIGTPVNRINFKINKLLNNHVEQENISLNNIDFSVTNHFLKNTLIFKNITKYEVLKKMYVDEGKVIGFIKIDNFRNLNSTLLTTDLFKAKEQIIRSIQNFSRDYEATVKAYSDDEYIVFMNASNLKQAMKDDFNILKVIRKYAKKEKLSISLSLGFSYNHSNILTLENLSLKSLELSRSRGGDQAVVYEYGKGNHFFGAETELSSNNSKVEIKNFTNNFVKNIVKVDNILIFGHINADFDCIGAMLGIVNLSNKHKKNVYFVNGSIEEKAETFLNKTIKKDTLDKILIKRSQAYKLIKEKTIIVIVDVSAFEQIFGKEILNKVDHDSIYIIDHHRVNGNSFLDVPNPQKYIMPSASSTCEIVTEMLDFDSSVLRVPVSIAQYLLTGIILDTNSFKQRTSARTFEAAAILQKWNASILISNEALKLNAQDSYIIKKIMDNASLAIDDIYIATLPEPEIADYAQISKACQDILNVENRKASFVIARIADNKIKISARSNGSYNVQLIMEKFNGGGGHFSSAATIVEAKTVDQVAKELYETIKNNTIMKKGK